MDIQLTALATTQPGVVIDLNQLADSLNQFLRNYGGIDQTLATAQIVEIRR